MATHFQNETDELATTANRNATLKEKDIQILSEIRDYKANGNELFRAGKIREAMRKYHNANLYLRTFQDSPFSSFGSRPDQVTSMSRLPQETKAEIQALTISIANNLAACALKLEKWESALRHTTTVLELDPENQKAIYRKGCASLNLNKIDDAIKYLRKAHELDPKDSAVKKQLAISYQQLKEYHNQEKSMFKGLFSSDHSSH